MYRVWGMVGGRIMEDHSGGINVVLDNYNLL